MKKNSKFSVLACLLLFAGLTLFAQGYETHIGKWKGESEGETGYFEFDSEGYVKMTMEGQTIGGKSYDIDGVKASLKYEIDYTKTPYYIDFVVYSLDHNAEIVRSKGMFIYNEKKQMIICLNFGETERPTEFLEDNTLTLDKVSD